MLEGNSQECSNSRSKHFYPIPRFCDLDHPMSLFKKHFNNSASTAFAVLSTVRSELKQIQSRLGQVN